MPQRVARSFRMAVVFTCAFSLGACCFLRPGFIQRFRPLSYVINGSVPSSWQSAITTAGNTWNGVYTTFSFGGYGGGSVNWVSDGVNSVFSRSTGFSSPAVLAAVRFMGFHPPDSGCGISDTDMGFNVNHPWSLNPSSFQIDVQSVALHEFGHYGWLSHVSCPQSSVMVRTLSVGQIKRNLRFCDSLGWWVTNNAFECWALTGICFPSFSFLKAFDDVGDEDQGTTEPFEHYHEELLQIWQGDSTLRTNADDVGAFYADLLDNWRNGGNLASSYTFTSARYQEIDSQIISRVYSSASSGLKSKLNGVRNHLQGKIGLTIGSIFSSDVEQYPPAGGYEGPGGEPPPA